MKKYFLLQITFLLLLLCIKPYKGNSQTGVYDTITDKYVLFVDGKYRPTIIESEKINTNPVIIDSTKKIPVKGYGIDSKKINTGFDVGQIPAAQMVNEPLTKLYNALVKIGFGNYTTPYGEVWYNSLRSKEYAYGIRLKHLSSSATLKDYGYAGYSDNEISLYGKKFLKDHTLSGSFDYTRNVIHFYGYGADTQNLNKDATVQRFNYFTATADLMSHYTQASRYNHDVKVSFYNLNDIYKASENNIKASGYVQTAVAKQTLKVNASVDYYNYKSPKDTANNTIITLNPNFIAKGEKYSASIGFTASADIFDSSKFHIYPNVDFSYSIVDNIIIPFAGASGSLQKNSFKTFTDENPFVYSSLAMANTSNKIVFYGGIKGKLSSKVAYIAKAAHTSIANMAIYVNDENDLLQNCFKIIYDDAEETNIHGEVSYQQREKLRINLSCDYYYYKMALEAKAWYKPQLKVQATANYNLNNKIIIKVDLFYIDKQFTKTVVDDVASKTGKTVVPVELKGVFDANIGGEYRYNKKLGFFINFNNLAAQRYFRYANYPTQKFFVILGLSYSF